MQPNDRVFRLYYVVITILAIVIVFMYIYTAQNTGVVKVRSSVANAVISISGLSTGAKIVGKGNISLRLKPGQYYVAASGQGNNVGQTVSVTKHKTVSVSLDLKSRQGLRTIDSVTFNNLSDLLNAGLSNTQVDLFRQYVYDFNSSVQEVTIIPGSVQPGPHNPNVDVGFNRSLQVKIDHTTYGGKVVYADANSLQLLLYGQDGSVIFDSNNVKQLTN